MKYWIGILLIIAGFGFINQFQSFDAYDALGMLLMIAGANLK